MSDLSKVLGLPTIGTERRKKRAYVSRSEVKKLHGNRCKICGRSEKDVGTLNMAHYRAHSRGGNVVFPLCPNCHAKYDRGLLKRAQLKKINLSPREYKRFQPKRKRVRKRGTIFDVQKAILG